MIHGRHRFQEPEAHPAAALFLAAVALAPFVLSCVSSRGLPSSCPADRVPLHQTVRGTLTTKTFHDDHRHPFTLPVMAVATTQFPLPLFQPGPFVPVLMLQRDEATGKCMVLGTHLEQGTTIEITGSLEGMYELAVFDGRGGWSPKRDGSFFIFATEEPKIIAIRGNQSRGK